MNIFITHWLGVILANSSFYFQRVTNQEKVVLVQADQGPEQVDRRTHTCLYGHTYIPAQHTHNIHTYLHKYLFISIYLSIHLSKSVYLSLKHFLLKDISPLRLIIQGVPEKTLR